MGLKSLITRWLATPLAPAASETSDLPPDGGPVTLPELERRISLLEQDWAEVLDKINRWFAREAARKRGELSKALADPPESVPSSAGPELVTDPPSEAMGPTVNPRKAALYARMSQLRAGGKAS